MSQIQQVCKADMSRYGVDKVCRQLKRQNIEVPQTVSVEVLRVAVD